MLVIHPNECIDCGACEPVCPAIAIFPDSEEGMGRWVELAREYADQWPCLSEKKSPLNDADQFKDVPDKFAKYFSPNPGSGVE